MEENNYINEQLLQKIGQEQNVKANQIKAVLKLIEEGGTVPFIARYRKQATGGLDEEQIRAIYKEWEYGRTLAALRKTSCVSSPKREINRGIKKRNYRRRQVGRARTFTVLTRKRKRGRRKRNAGFGAPGRILVEFPA